MVTQSNLSINPVIRRKRKGTVTASHDDSADNLLAGSPKPCLDSIHRRIKNPANHAFYMALTHWEPGNAISRNLTGCFDTSAEHFTVITSEGSRNGSMLLYGLYNRKALFFCTCQLQPSSNILFQTHLSDKLERLLQSCQSKMTHNTLPWKL